MSVATCFSDEWSFGIVKNPQASRKNPVVSHVQEAVFILSGFHDT